MKQPVKLMWSREEDTRQDFYRPASMARLRASLDSGKSLTGMIARVAAPSILASVRPGGMQGGMDPIGLQAFADQPYAIANYRAEFAMRNTHVPVGFWRSVNHSQNAYFRECFLDEIARASARDPFELRRELLKDSPKQLAVLEAVAETAGWSEPPAEGVHRGIALDTSYGSHCAQVFEIRLHGGKDLELLRVVCAIDPGHVVNPDTVEAQVESAIVYGLTAALYGEINIDKGRAVQGNFDDYPMLLLRHMPEVVTVSVPSGDFWGGLGEPPLPPLAPALCNAIHSAIGKPIRSLPLSKHGIRPA
jgi:isoquinoline 1-oxidoreductase beta subunit